MLNINRSRDHPSFTLVMHEFEHFPQDHFRIYAGERERRRARTTSIRILHFPVLPSAVLVGF